jgi:hypothetical protein
VRIESAREIFDFFQEKGIACLVVGGAAIAVEGIGATTDVDLLLTVRDYAGAGNRVSADPRVTQNVHYQGPTASGLFRTEYGDVRFDILDPATFSGKRSGDEFFDYANRRWASDTRIGRTAQPALVFYTRLIVPGERYLERIIDDLDDGAPEEWLDETLAIANFCGTTGRIREQLLRISELRGIVGTKRKESAA